MSRAQSPDRTVSESIGGKDATLEVYDADPDFEARIRIEREDRWEFGLHEDGVAELLTTTAVDGTVHAKPTIPQWVADSLYEVEIPEIIGIAGVA